MKFKPGIEWFVLIAGLYGAVAAQWDLSTLHDLCTNYSAIACENYQYIIRAYVGFWGLLLSGFIYLSFLIADRKGWI